MPYTIGLMTCISLSNFVMPEWRHLRRDCSVQKSASANRKVVCGTDCEKSQMSRLDFPRRCGKATIKGGRSLWLVADDNCRDVTVRIHTISWTYNLAAWCAPVSCWLDVCRVCRALEIIATVEIGNGVVEMVSDDTVASGGNQRPLADPSNE